MTQTIEYWRETDQAWHAGGPGIAVVTADDAYTGTDPQTGRAVFLDFPATFRGLVNDALRYIHATPAGRQILQQLSAASAASIVPALLGNSVKAADGALNLVAEELIPNSLIGGVTQAALNRLTIPAHAQPRWLAHVINSAQELLLDAVPGSGTGFWAGLEKARQYANQWTLLGDPRYARWSSSNEGYFNDQTVARSLDGRGYDIGITVHEVAAWIAGQPLPGRLSQRARNHALVATLAALRHVSPSGNGSASDIGWNPYPSNPLNLSRPAAIGLAHELVHAYYSGRGEQLGRDFGHPTTVLFEFLCVGLGPWDEAAISENGIRRHWYSHAVPLMPRGEKQSRKAMPKRIKYL
ncbi:M91 family zinc metallopeptidase [Pseudomonas sp. zfem002]|uniref:M91 family zinc metallopeptidase n=1 Tax=Pseudomonas sp. zfem002 TaxID=3078197 RepID=UPI0029281371|nr:M91 family zinc metallopeptidase [Pseudomonas sp. zfem002]MDU9393345.1 M91 family zinc metallopeptidase [Pseudomonas sp. zfem002]